MYDTNNYALTYKLEQHSKMLAEVYYDVNKKFEEEDEN